MAAHEPVVPMQLLAVTVGVVAITPQLTVIVFGTELKLL